MYSKLAAYILLNGHAAAAAFTSQIRLLKLLFESMHQTLIPRGSSSISSATAVLVDFSQTRLATVCLKCSLLLQLETSGEELWKLQMYTLEFFQLLREVAKLMESSLLSADVSHTPGLGNVEESET